MTFHGVSYPFSPEALFSKYYSPGSEFKHHVGSYSGGSYDQVFTEPSFMDSGESKV